MKPKMQLAPGDYVTEAFRAAMNQWMIDFFGYEDAYPSEDTATPKYYECNTSVDAPLGKSRKKNNTKTQIQPDFETFSDLLEGLSDSFSSLKMPPLKGSWLEKRNIQALHKIGIYIPTPMSVEHFDSPIISKDIKLPAIASSLLLTSKHDTKDKLHPRFVFAIKSPKLPERVEAIKGTPYQFGFCVQMSSKDNGDEMDPEMFWMWCWMVVANDGSIKIPLELQSVRNVIRHKDRRSTGSRTNAVFNRQWRLPELAVARKDLDQSAFESFMKSLFRQLFIWWGNRSDQWSVGVRKDGHRVTFSIDKRHTSAYFADRKKSITKNGKSRKIVHFVKEHTRSNGSVVKPHIRGVTDFEWSGYHCSVTAPKFNGSLTSLADISPVLISHDDDDGYISTQEMAEILANQEDRLAA